MQHIVQLHAGISTCLTNKDWIPAQTNKRAKKLKGELSIMQDVPFLHAGMFCKDAQILHLPAHQ